MYPKKILMPNCKIHTFYCGDHQTWGEIIETVILPKWAAYCNSHWIDYNNHDFKWSFENRVKAFLDRLGWLFMMDSPSKKIESEYKTMVHKVMEIPMTECMPSVGDMYYSQRTSPIDSEEEAGRFQGLLDRLDMIDKRPKRPPNYKKKDTRFNRIERIRKQSPNARFTWCIVDGDNGFLYDGKEYVIPDGDHGYHKNTGDDNVNSFDRILVVDHGSRIDFYSQTINNIDNISKK